MSATSWSGRKVPKLIAAVLHTKGRTCHLCGMDGADSADHDPPRSVLIAEGVVNPDAMRYLFPSHLQPCNLARGARPITDELRSELRAKRIRWLELRRAESSLSPRFARRRATFLRR